MLKLSTGMCQSYRYVLKLSTPLRGTYFMPTCLPVSAKLSNALTLSKEILRKYRMTLGGGLLQLVAQGKQDVFLTGNPQITWFKMVYRRYTNFSVESQAIYFDGTPDFGKRLTCVVPRRGDLLGPLLLEITLPQIKYKAGTYINTDGNATTATFTGSVSATILTVTAMSTGPPASPPIEEGMYLIGSGITPGTQIISSGTGTGGVGTYTVSVSYMGTVSVNEATTKTFIVQDQNDKASYITNLGHAMIEEVSVEIGEQEIDKQTGEWMHIWSKLSTQPGVQAGFNDMVYNYADGVAPPSTQPVLDNSVSIGGSTYQYGAVKLYVPLQFWFNKNPGLYLPLLALQYHPIRLNLKLRPLSQLIQFYDTNCSNNAACANPPELEPAKIIDLRLYGDFVNLDTEERRRFVSNSHEYLIEQIQYTPNISIPDKTTTAMVSLDFNHPLREIIWIIQRDCMTTVNDWFNYSPLSTFLGESGNNSINMLQQALLQLDGYDRFEVRDAGYFRLVQPYQYHTNVPTDTFIYCYSFAIRPEELQPSGSLNASRIDSMNLQIALRPDPPSTLTDQSDPRYVPIRGNAHIRIYTTNHNILRIVNGFGGLLFKI